MERSYRYIDIISALFVTVLLVSNIASVKILDFGPFSFDGGTILFPLSYIFGDLITEVYGYQRSRRIFWIGFVSAVLMSFTFYFVGFLPSSKEWLLQDQYMNILGVTWRIVVASLIAYFAGEFSNSYVLAKMKVWMKGEYMWIRLVLSTVVGEFFDTLLFVLIAFYGTLPNDLIMTIIVSNYIFKVGFEFVFSPVTLKVISFLKKKENEDYYDRKTDFNPFIV